MTVERIDIQIREDGSRVVKRNIESIGTTAKASATGVNILKSALLGLGSLLALNELRKYADAWSAVNGMVRVATASTQEATAVMDELFKVSQKTRQGVVDMVELYSRLAIAGREVGASQADLIKFTENIGKTLAFSNRTTDQARGALLQLGQAVGGVLVRAEEFNSILEGAPAILQIAANNIDEAGGSIIRLRQIMIQERLTSKMFFEAIMAGTDEINAKFSKSAFTIGQSFIIIRNAFTKWIGEADAAIGISNAIGKAARYISDNMSDLLDTIVRLTKTVAVAAVAYGAFLLAMKVNAIVESAKAFLGLTAAVASGNVVMLGSAAANSQKAIAVLASAEADRAAVIAATLKADAEGAGIILTTRAAVANAAAAADRIRWSQAQLVSERELEIVRMKAQISDIGRMQSATRLAGIRTSELAMTKLLTTAEAELTAAKAAASAASSAQLARATQQSAALAAAGANVAAAQAAVATTGAAAAGTTTVFGQAMLFLRNMLNSVYTRVVALFVLINAHPFVALATAIIATIGVLVVWGDKLNAGVDDLTTMKDVALAVWEQIRAGLLGLYGILNDVFGGILSVIGNVLTTITAVTAEQIKAWLSYFDGFYDGVGKGFAGVARSVARTMDAIAGLLTGLGIGVVRAFAGIPGAISEMFKRTYNVVIGIVEKLVNVVVDGVNVMRDAVGMSLIEVVQFERMEVDKTFFEDYGKNIANSINDGFTQQGGFLEGWVDGVLKRAQEIARDRAPLEDIKVDLNRKPLPLPPLAGKPDPNADKALRRLKESLQSLLNQIAPIEGAMMEMAAAVETLDAARRKGLITAEQEGRYLELLSRYYMDILNPLGAMNREIDQQTALLGMSAAAREVEGQVLEATKELLKQGIMLTKEETQALRDKLTTLQELNRITQVQDEILANSVGARQAYIDQLTAINKLLAEGQITKGDATAQMMQSTPELFEGTQEAIDLQIERFRYMYEQIDLMRQKDLISDATAEQMRAKVANQQWEERTKNFQSFFGNMASLMKSGNSKLFKIGQAAALAQASIDAASAIMKAYSSAPYPYNIALAAAQAAASAVQIAQIAGATPGFQTGGEFKVGGSGGADSQMVAFRATPGEKVAVSTPQQQRKGDPNSGGASNQKIEFKPQIINVRDPKEIPNAIESGEGQQSILNVIGYNMNVIREMLKSG